MTKSPCPNCGAARTGIDLQCPACSWRPRPAAEIMCQALAMRIELLERRSRRLTVLLMLAFLSSGILFAYMRWGHALGSRASFATVAAERLEVERIDIVDSLAAKQPKSVVLTFKEIDMETSALAIWARREGALRLVVDQPDKSRIVWPSGKVFSEGELEVLRDHIRRLQDVTEVLRRPVEINWRQELAFVRERIDTLERRLRELEAKK